MRKRTNVTVWAMSVGVMLASSSATWASPQDHTTPRIDVKLPKPNTTVGMPLAQALAKRRTHRAFSDKPLTLEQIGQLCWAAQGITEAEKGLRTAPSAGAIYPVTVYVLTRDGVFEYLPKLHALHRRAKDDIRTQPQAGPLGKKPVRGAPVCLVLAMDPSRTAKRWPQEAERYALLEAGHIAQNVLLQATALGLVGVPVGGADEQAVAVALKLRSGQRPVYVLPVGHAAKVGESSSK